MDKTLHYEIDAYIKRQLRDKFSGTWERTGNDTFSDGTRMARCIGRLVSTLKFELVEA